MSFVMDSVIIFVLVSMDLRTVPGTELDKEDLYLSALSIFSGTTDPFQANIMEHSMLCSK